MGGRCTGIRTGRQGSEGKYELSGILYSLLHVNSLMEKSARSIFILLPGLHKCCLVSCGPWLNLIHSILPFSSLWGILPSVSFLSNSSDSINVTVSPASYPCVFEFLPAFHNSQVWLRNKHLRSFPQFLLANLSRRIRKLRLTSNLTRLCLVPPNPRLGLTRYRTFRMLIEGPTTPAIPDSSACLNIASPSSRNPSITSLSKPLLASFNPFTAPVKPFLAVGALP